MKRSTFAISIVSSHVFIFELTLTQLPLKMSYSVWVPLPEWFVAFCSSEYGFLVFTYYYLRYFRSLL